jgi:hypothetical protein
MNKLKIKVVIKFTPKTTARVPLDIHIKDNLTDEVNALNVKYTYRQTII